jgi:hypothetical protein
LTIDLECIDSGRRTNPDGGLRAKPAPLVGVGYTF